MKHSRISFRACLLLMGVGIALGILSAVPVMGFLSGFESQTQVTSTVLRSSLESARDLISTRYNYARVGQFTNSSEINGWKLPFTKKNFLLAYQGQICLGVDLEDAVIDVKDTVISISLPAVRILSHTIDENSVEIFDEKTNLFNPISIGDYMEFAVGQKEEAEQEVREKGIFEQAQEQAEEAVRALLNLIPEVKDNYTIRIVFESLPADPGSENAEE